MFIVSAILIKNAPSRVHDWLRRTAVESRRSMTQQVVYCFGWCMDNMHENIYSKSNWRR